MPGQILASIKVKCINIAVEGIDDLLSAFFE